jgi:hypothetical protein
MLYRKMTIVKSELKMALKEMKGRNPKWRTTREDFAKGRQDLLKFVSDLQFYPDQNW